MWNFPLLPDRASTVAGQVDALYYFLVAVSVFFSLVIVIGLLYSAIRYRRGSKASRAGAKNDHLPLELLWSITPLTIAFVIFSWSAKLFLEMRVPPADAMEVYVVGKQWMWKIQHPQGNREINELHVPAGKPVKLIMTSQDVIHSFFIPAFRTKQDVLPGRYSTEWFEATKPGTYHLFCAEYCGTSHSGMTGNVIVMDPADYEQWLSGKTGMTMASGGEQLFQQFGCHACHRRDTGQRGPSLEGLWGRQVKLAGGEVVTADQHYVRESIMNPGAKVVSSYQVLMPNYRSQLSEDQLNQLIEYIKMLGGQVGKK
ncbi:MAG TPA: cytochrome c oxidase subunit II [Bacteroidota bacterium]|jgi:cytochrome c oxidase subunit 2|nr:cytochrome c oxidase subunit II [Bacteroidota bacterium]